MNLWRQLPFETHRFKEGPSTVTFGWATVQSSYETKEGWSTEVAILFLKQENRILGETREPKILMIHGPQKIMEDGHLK